MTMSLPIGVFLDDEPLDAPWIRGCRRGAAPGPVLQVRRVDDATFILRESMRATWEAPFVYLLLGARRALLLDTGDVAEAERMPLGATVGSIVGDWVAAHRLSDYELVVAHTHGHNDHTRGDAQFIGDSPAYPYRATVVGTAVEKVREFFGFDAPDSATLDSVVPFDLGDRELSVTRVPGHDVRSIAVIDPSRGLMFSGDTAYPGRLYVQDLTALRDSLDRMLALAHRHHLRSVLGGHIEYSADGGEHPVGVRFHADEQPLPLTVAQLQQLRDLAHRGSTVTGVVAGSPMSLWIGSCNGAKVKLAGAAAVRRLRGIG
ncbi:MBL fold metallo-hydrolase [Dermatophilaceae bacterium Sec6.4]